MYTPTTTIGSVAKNNDHHCAFCKASTNYYDELRRAYICLQCLLKIEAVRTPPPYVAPIMSPPWPPPSPPMYPPTPPFYQVWCHSGLRTQ